MQPTNKKKELGIIEESGRSTVQLLKWPPNLWLPMNSGPKILICWYAQMPPERCKTISVHTGTENRLVCKHVLLDTKFSTLQVQEIERANRGLTHPVTQQQSEYRRIHASHAAGFFFSLQVHGMMSKATPINLSASWTIPLSVFSGGGSMVSFRPHLDTQILDTGGSNPTGH